MSIVLNGDTGITTPAETVSGAVTAATVTATGLISGATNYTGFKNRIINGAMVVNQRATAVTATAYTVDRFSYNAAQTSKATVSQDTSVYPTGFNSSLKVLSSSAYAILTGDYFTIEQPIEGLNCIDLAWGTASAANVTLSFWVRSSLTGTFGGAIYAVGGPLSYPFSYTISAANTWEQKTVSIAGPTVGTFVTTNATCFTVCFAIGVGATYSSTAGSWQSSTLRSATGATSVVGTSGATFYITGVQLEKGSTATSFDYRPYGTELALCQRYYWQTGSPFAGVPAWTYSTTQFGTTLWHPTTMRTSPTVASVTATTAYTFYFNAGSTQFNSVTANNTNVFCADLYATTSGKTSGQAGFFGISASGNITVSAEL